MRHFLIVGVMLLTSCVGYPPDRQIKYYVLHKEYGEVINSDERYAAALKRCGESRPKLKILLSEEQRNRYLSYQSKSIEELRKKLGKYDVGYEFVQLDHSDEVKQIVKILQHKDYCMVFKEGWLSTKALVVSKSTGKILKEF